MRGETNPRASMFSYVDLESRIPEQHPVRKVRRVVDNALRTMEPAFNEMYSQQAGSSIPPEQLTRALLFKYFHHSLRTAVNGTS